MKRAFLISGLVSLSISLWAFLVWAGSVSSWRSSFFRDPVDALWVVIQGGVGAALALAVAYTALPPRTARSFVVGGVLGATSIVLAWFMFNSIPPIG